MTTRRGCASGWTTAPTPWTSSGRVAALRSASSPGPSPSSAAPRGLGPRPRGSRGPLVSRPAPSPSHPGRAARRLPWGWDASLAKVSSSRPPLASRPPNLPRSAVTVVCAFRVRGVRAVRVRRDGLPGADAHHGARGPVRRLSRPAHRGRVTGQGHGVPAHGERTGSRTRPTNRSQTGHRPRDKRPWLLLPLFVVFCLSEFRIVCPY